MAQSVKEPHVKRNAGLIILVFLLAAHTVDAADTVSVNLFAENYSLQPFLISSIQTDNKDSVSFKLSGPLPDIYLGDYFRNRSNYATISGMTLTVAGKQYIQQRLADQDLQVIFGGHNIDDIVASGRFSIFKTLVSSDGSYFIGNFVFVFQDGDLFVLVEGVAHDSPDIEKRLLALETWQEGISSTIQNIETMLLQIKEWLFFNTYSEDTLCNAVVTECGVGNIPEPEEPSEDTVIFRTNIEQGDYGGQDAPRWIALDRDGDEALEGYGFIQKAAWDSARCANLGQCPGSFPCSLMKTPTFDDVVDYGSSDKLLVCSIRNDQQVIFQRGAGEAGGAVLSVNPTDPYASNNQEVLG